MAGDHPDGREVKPFITMPTVFGQGREPLAGK
jgi:hypothetical protein